VSREQKGNMSRAAAPPSPAAGRALNASDAPGVEVLPAPRAAALLPADLLRDDEIIILLIRPSLLFIPLSCLTSLVVIACIALFLAYLARWRPSVGWSDTYAFALGIGLATLRLSWQALEWYCQVYVLTDRRVIRRMGVLRVAVFQTQLKNIQHTSVFTRVRERLFGLGTIGFATSGSDVFEAFWLMIRQPFAVHRTIIEAMERYRS
jgi:hypothetical protein